MSQKIKKLSIFILSIVVIVFLFGLTMTYAVNTDNAFTQAVRNIIPIPLLRVNGSSIRMSELRRGLDAVQYYYETGDFASIGVRVDFTTNDGQKRLKILEREVLNKLIENHAIVSLAKKQGITVEDKDVKEVLAKLLAQKPVKGTPSLKEELEDYNFSVATYAEHVIRPLVYEQRLQARFDKANPVTNTMRERLQEARKKVTDGTDFATVAEEYSDGPTSKDGAMYGAFVRGQLEKPIEDIVFSASEGTITDAIETIYGLHIFLIENKIKSASDEEMVVLRHILIRKKAFSTYLTEEIEKMSVRVFMPGYVWDAQRGALLFEDPALRAFEVKQLRDFEDSAAREREASSTQ